MAGQREIWFALAVLERAAGLFARDLEAHERTLVVEVSGSAVGTLRLTREGDDAGIYGFAIDPSWQGRGLGRDALRRACEQLRAEGARRIRLEVAVENDRALALHTSSGFKPVSTEDYFSLKPAVSGLGWRRVR